MSVFASSNYCFQAIHVLEEQLISFLIFVMHIIQFKENPIAELLQTVFSIAQEPV